MNNLFSDFSTRVDWEKDGVEFNWEGSEGPIFRCRIARNGGSNNRTEKLREKLFAPLRRMRDPSDEIVHKISMRICAEGCALPGSWQFYLREGMRFEDKTFCNGQWQRDVEGSLQPCDPPAACKGVEDGWIKGIEIEPDVIVPDTADNVEKVFQKLPELYSHISAFASNVNNYRDTQLEEDSKNS
jgi:hypothetical protein